MFSFCWLFKQSFSVAASAPRLTMSNIGYMSAWQSSDTPCCLLSPGWTSPTDQQGQISLFTPKNNKFSCKSVKWPKITIYHITTIKLLHCWDILQNQKILCKVVIIIDSHNKEKYSTLPSSWWLWRPVWSCPPRPCQSGRPRRRGHQVPSACRPGPEPWDTCLNEKLEQTILVGKTLFSCMSDCYDVFISHLGVL